MNVLPTRTPPTSPAAPYRACRVAVYRFILRPIHAGNGVREDACVEMKVALIESVTTPSVGALTGAALLYVGKPIGGVLFAASLGVYALVQYHRVE